MILQWVHDGKQSNESHCQVQAVIGVDQHLVEDHPAGAHKLKVFPIRKRMIDSIIEVNETSKGVEYATDSLNAYDFVDHCVHLSLAVPGIE